MISLKFPLRAWPQNLERVCRSCMFVIALVSASQATRSTQAALLAYEPFTNAPGTQLIGSIDGFGFAGAWQANSSSGTATNTQLGLNYVDPSGNTLRALGGAGFFQGPTTADGSMEPIRLFNFSRGTNGTDATTTWISFMISRQGPTGTLADNPYGRGANLPHDLHTGALQKLAIGNSSNASTNAIGLIPQGSGANLQSSAHRFGGQTNFVVVRIDHVPGASLDSAYLFVNPELHVEPSTTEAGAISLGAFDFSFDRLRAFAGGQRSADQPYAELVIDEYRLGESYADVTPYVPAVVPGPIQFTNVTQVAEGLLLSGRGGISNNVYYVLASTNVGFPVWHWQVAVTNHFDGNGDFSFVRPLQSVPAQGFYRLVTGALPQPPPVAPEILLNPQSLTATQGQTVAFTSFATGSPLAFQWFFNTNTPVVGGMSSNLVIEEVQISSAGRYHVRVTNAAGSATSSFALLSVIAPPEIVTEPQSQIIPRGSGVTFSAVALGTAPLQYQWYFNGTTPLAGATQSDYRIEAVRTNDVGGYHVVVTNSHGAATSAVAVLTLASSLVPGAFFVSPSGSDANPGTEENPFRTLTKGINTIQNNGVLYVRGGTYDQSSKLSLNHTGTTNRAIRVWAYPGEVPVIDSTGNSSDGVSLSGHNYHLRGLVVRKAGHNGINISGSSNLVEFCTVHDNGNTGLHITGSQSGTTFPAYNLILNCDAYLNYDPPIGGNADGFSAKWDLGPGNVFRGCRAWWNSDDGWDLWMANDAVLIEDCWAFYSGTNYWGSPDFNGNGNGFKLGGNYVGAPHRLLRSVAFRNVKHGIDQNNNLAGLTIDHNTSWSNGARNFYLDHNSNNQPMTGQHVVRNNLSIDGASGDTFWPGTLLLRNGWQVISRPAANNADLQSINESVPLAPRQADGSLPVWPFLRPVPSGRLIDQGIDIGEPYVGAAPDLGAFEVGE